MLVEEDFHAGGGGIMHRPLSHLYAEHATPKWISSVPLREGGGGSQVNVK